MDLWVPVVPIQLGSAEIILSNISPIRSDRPNLQDQCWGNKVVSSAIFVVASELTGAMGQRTLGTET